MIDRERVEAYLICVPAVCFMGVGWSIVHNVVIVKGGCGLNGIQRCGLLTNHFNDFLSVIVKEIAATEFKTTWELESLVLGVGKLSIGKDLLQE